MSRIDALIDAWRSKRPDLLPDVGEEFGGIEARILYLLRDPGPAVAATRHLSLDNPDPTARMQKTLLHDAGVPPAMVLPWNAYPWWRDDQDRAPSIAELVEAVPLHLELIDALPQLAVVVLEGSTAATAWIQVTLERPSLEQQRDLVVLRTFHPSGRGIGADARRRAHALATWERARALALRQ